MPAGELYKFEINTAEGAVFLKPDPFAACSEPAPSCASIIADLDGYRWTDEVWLREGRLASVRDHSVRGKLCTATPPAIPALLAGQNYIELSASIVGPAGKGLLVCRTSSEAPAALMAGIDACHHRDVGVMLAFDIGSLPAASCDLA